MFDVVGIVTTCSDKSPKQAITFTNKFGADTPRALYRGPDAPNGIRDMVVNGIVRVTAIGYADALVGVLSGESMMSVDVWRQVDSEYAPCVLKGIEVAPEKLLSESVDKVRLHFNCPSTVSIPTPTSTSSARTVPGTTVPAVWITEGSVASPASSASPAAVSDNSTTLMIVIGSVGGVVLLLVGFVMFVRNRRQLHK
ncbi:hypothetical protein BCR44DRAFT_58068 [Catenaria anguillulae PL171]|uniref:Uncharacterized protein n=1 Tax=Catenaria anguillulae PL171 TaxID=765915 RepID=A0A1Y2HC69_9FUNG|nr:hypothetical protein BCR44DRAFT_58068 [Catenaria anguillulae PL171]